jgi:hypothetical protein
VLDPWFFQLKEPDPEEAFEKDGSSSLCPLSPSFLALISMFFLICLSPSAQNNFKLKPLVVTVLVCCFLGLFMFRHHLARPSRAVHRESHSSFDPSSLLALNVDPLNPKVAFVSFTTLGSYLELAKVLLDSIHYFSDFPIILYCIDCDLPFTRSEYPRLVPRRICSAPHSMYFNKLQIVTHSGLEVGLYIETDDIVNHGVDVLFEVARRYAGRFPLLLLCVFVLLFLSISYCVFSSLLSFSFFPSLLLMLSLFLCLPLIPQTCRRFGASLLGTNQV